MKKGLVAGVLLGTLLICSACAQETHAPITPKPSPSPGETTHIVQPTTRPDGGKTEDDVIKEGQACPGRELIATVDSQEGAEQIAELYGIELVEWSGHIAVYHTDEMPSQVIALGKQNGWPPLSVNRSVQLRDP